MLICFGALFPPLALVIALSLFKDIMNIRLLLGRYYMIMKVTIGDTEREENEKPVGIQQERMLKPQNSMNEEIMKAGVEIWNGVWYGVIMASWIWAFVLFDTLSSSVGLIEGIWVLIFMSCVVLLLSGIFAIATKLSTWLQMQAITNDSDESRIIGYLEKAVKNPLNDQTDSIVEMRGTFVSESCEQES
jgi:hypothetical protein